MTTWSKNELDKIAHTDDLHIAKYKGSPYVGPMISARARAATVMVTPREDEAR